jgi:hypothetical protein
VRQAQGAERQLRVQDLALFVKVVAADDGSGWEMDEEL